MAKEPKALLVIVSVGMLVYVASLGGVSSAEIGSAQTQERIEGVTISLEACVVRVAAEALAENASSGSGEGEREEEVNRVFEVSSQIGLQAGRPLVAGAKRDGDAAMFLILHADI